MPNGTKINGPVELREELASHPEFFVETLTERLLMYAVNRRLEYFDMPQVRKIARDAKKDNDTFASLVSGVVNTDAFRMQGPAGKAPAKLAPVSQVTSQVTAEKLPGASAVKAAEARSGPAAVSAGKN